MKHTQTLLMRPINEWTQRLMNVKRDDLLSMEDELSALIQRATLLQAYVSHRWNTGCGDQGHDDSAKIAKRTLVKVRKALGYSYPQNTPLSIP